MMNANTTARPSAALGVPPKGLHCVVGSGPAGAACAQALVERGCEVLVLDAGVQLEPERQQLVADLRRSAPAAWTASQLAQLKEGVSATSKGIPLKRLFGSDFPYRGPEEHMPSSFDGVGLRASMAYGGFSTVWGSAMMPYAQRDIADWPIQLDDLAPHYAAVLKFTGLSARADGLATEFPLYTEPRAALALSRQASLLLRNLEAGRAGLTAAGLRFGQARVAVKVAEPAGAAGCVYCRLCMYGCPYGYIYNSADTIQQLQSHAGFRYQPDAVVTNVREDGAKAVVTGYHRLTRVPFELEAERVYLAAGVLPTTRILLHSTGGFDQPVYLRDSQYFLLPLLLARGAGDVRSEALHALCQLFLEIIDPQVSPHTVHLQVYSYNDLVGQAVRKTFGPLARPLEFMARALESRLLILQGYLHSEHSARIQATLRRGPSGAPEQLELAAKLNPETRRQIRRVIGKLSRHALTLGAVPLPVMLQVAEPGRGFHTGGSFPMRREPGAFQTDLLGRLRGWNRVHAVDATVLPSIPATTITLSAMANAHRIAWESVGGAVNQREPVANSCSL